MDPESGRRSDARLAHRRTRTEVHTNGTQKEAADATAAQGRTVPQAEVNDNERLELWIQGAIAMIIVVGIVTLSVAQVLLAHPVQVPDLLGWALAGVLGYFFGAGRGRGITTGVATATNGMLTAATKIANIQPTQESHTS